MISNKKAGEAGLTLPVKYDFTGGDYECALIQVILPNTQSVRIPATKLSMLWHVPRGFDGFPFGNNFAKELVPGSDYFLITEDIEPQLPSFPHTLNADLCVFLTKLLDDHLKHDGFKPRLSSHRGFVEISVATRRDSKGSLAIGLPIFDVKLKKVLGLEDDDSRIKEFLKTSDSKSVFTSSKVANIYLDVYYNEVFFNAAESIVPRDEEHKVLRYFPNSPLTPRSVFYNFDPPIWCPVEKKRFKFFKVNIKDNEGDDIIFEGGKSIFKIAFRKRNE